MSNENAAGRADEPMSALIPRLIAAWGRAGLRIRADIPRSRLDEFEARHDVVMPADLWEYFAAVDGMDVGDMDLENISFHALEQVKPLSGELADPPIGGLTGDPDDYFIVADYLIDSIVYVVRMTAAGETSPVLALCGNYVVPVADSFRGFVELYLSDSDAVVDPWPPGSLRSSPEPPF